MSEFGDAKFDEGSNRTFKKSFKIEWGDNVFRVLPAFGSLKFDGKWNQYYRIHWGALVLTSEGKTSPRPFLCVEERDWKTKEIKVRCAACEQVGANKDKAMAVEVKMKAEGKPEAEIKEATKKYNEWDKAHNTDGKYYTNAISPAGEVALLPLGRNFKNALEARCKELQADGINAMSVNNGVWFVFRKTKGATFNETGHDVLVQKVKETLANGRIAEYVEGSSLTEAQIQAALAGATDLKLQPPARRLTPEEIERLVNSGWDLEVATALFSSPEKPEKSAPSNYSNGVPRTSSVSAPVYNTPETRQAPAPAPAPVKEETVQKVVAELDPAAQIAALQAQLAALQAPLAPAPAAAPSPAGETPAQARSFEQSAPSKTDALGGKSVAELGNMTPEQFREWIKSNKK